MWSCCLEAKGQEARQTCAGVCQQLCVEYLVLCESPKRFLSIWKWHLESAPKFDFCFRCFCCRPIRSNIRKFLSINTDLDEDPFSGMSFWLFCSFRITVLSIAPVWTKRSTYYLSFAHFLERCFLGNSLHCLGPFWSLTLLFLAQFLQCDTCFCEYQCEYLYSIY